MKREVGGVEKVGVGVGGLHLSPADNDEDIVEAPEVDPAVESDTACTEAARAAEILLKGKDTLLLKKIRSSGGGGKKKKKKKKRKKKSHKASYRSSDGSSTEYDDDGIDEEEEFSYRWRR